MNRPHDTMFTLQRIISDFSKIHRNHHILNSDRSENDIEHSFAVTLLCWYIIDTFKIKLDINKVIKYALVHDLVEVYAGDVNTFASSEERERKVKDEAKAAKRLTGELSDFPDLVKTLHDYESRKDEESLFVWSVDKMQALILADLDGWRPYKKLNITYDSFVKKHHEHVNLCSPYCRDIFETLLEYCKTTYYDKPFTNLE